MYFQMVKACFDGQEIYCNNVDKMKVGQEYREEINTGGNELLGGGLHSPSAFLVQILNAEGEKIGILEETAKTLTSNNTATFSANFFQVPG